MSQTNPNVSLFELFRGFATIGLLGFGGVAAISRHIIVEKNKWLSEKDYATILGMGQVLPGPNVVNASVVIGDRFQGVKGSLVSVLGLMVPPICILLILASLYDNFSHLQAVNVALMGGAAAASGMIIGTGLKMAQKIKPGAAGWLIIAAVLISILILKWPLVYIVLGLIPTALALTYWLSKKMIDIHVLLQLAKTFASLSLVAIGGANAVFPALRQAIVQNMAWMDDATFLQLFAIAQITPGPNVVVVSLLGWQIAGLPGLLVATVSMVLPAAILAFAVGRIANQVAGSPGFKLAQNALVPLAIGLLIAGGLDLALAAPGGWFISVLVALCALSVVYTKANPIWGIVASALAALAAHYSGLVQLL